MRSSGRSSGHAYARAGARGIALGLLISLAVVAPFAISAADPQPSTTPQSTAQPQATDTAQPTATPEPTLDTTVEPNVEPTALPATEPTPEPSADQTPQPTDEPTAEPTPEPTETLLPTETPSPTPTTISDGVGLIVTFATNAAFAERSSSIALVGGVETDAIDALRMATVTVPAAGAAAAVDTLRALTGVSRVETEHERTIEADPNDPHFTDQWALAKIGWSAARDSGAPAGSAIVAILDTGVDGSHPDLAGQLVEGASFAGDAAWNTDPNGHGTAMAGIVAALVDNSEGLAGVAFGGVKVMPVTVLGADGTGVDGDIIAGIVWAIDHGAEVISMSFSSPTYSPSLQAAIDYAWRHDVVLVAATGNDGTAAVTYPAGDRGVIGVSNTDQADHLNSSSNHGADTFLAAPGTDVVATTPAGNYVSVTGTSASAAMVAAAAGLLRAADPAASNGQVAYRLAATAADVAPVDEVGNGRLDLAAAYADRSAGSVQPAGAGVFGNGGPIVDPIYTAAACVWSGANSSAWEDSGNWSGCLGAGGLPGATDSTSVPVTANSPLITVTTGTAIVKDLTIAVGATVSMTGGTLEIWHDWKNSGTFNGTGGTVQFRASGGAGPTFAASNQFYDILVDAGVDPGFDNTTASVINISHNFTNNNTALPATTSATFVFNGTGDQQIYSAKTGTAATFGNLTVNKSGGTLTFTSNANVTGMFTITSGTVDLTTFTANRAAAGNGMTMAAGTLLRVGGSTGPTGYTTSSLDAASTVEYYGTDQSVTSLNYGNLTLKSGGTKTAAGAITTTGTFLLDTSTTFAASTFTHNFSAGFTVNGTYSPGTSTANFNGTSNQAIAGTTNPITFNTLTVNSSATVSLSTNVTVAGNLTVNGGTLDFGAFTADRTAAGGTLTVGSGDTLKVGATYPANFTTNTLNATSTVEYSGSTQSIAGVTYGNLTLSGSGTKTPTAGVTVATDFTIGTGVTFAAGALTHSFGGNFTNNGTFTDGGSTAVFTNGAGTIGGSSTTAFGTISITTGAITTSQSISATSLTLANNNVANSFTVGTGTTTTVNGNVVVNQASGGGVIHALNVNAGTMTVTGSLTVSVTASNAGRIAKVVVTTGTLSLGGDLIVNSATAANGVIDLSAGASTLKIGGALTINTLVTWTPGTASTVVYNGTGAQTVVVTAAVTYNTIEIDKPSGTATLGAALTTANVNNVTLTQGTFSTNNLAVAIDGTWTNNGGTLSGGTSTVTFSGTSAVITGTGSTDFPAVAIAAAAVVAMNNSNTATSLTFTATGAAQSLTHANGTTFTVSGATTLNQPTGSFTSAWNINQAAVTTNGLITFAGTNATAARVAKIVITSGTLNANAGITFTGSVAAGKVIDMSGGAGTLNLKGALTVPALSSTLTAGTSGSTFVYADTNAQTINFFTAGAYHNLSVSNSSASGATLSAAISAANVTGNLRVLTGGKLDNGGFAVVGNASKTFEVQDGATFRLGGTSAWPTGFGTFTLGGATSTSTVEYYGGAQNVAATATIGSNYDNLTMSGTAVTKTLLGDITCDKQLTVNSSATFALSNKNVTCGSLTGNGTIQFGNGAVTNMMTIGSDGTSTTFSGAINSTNDAADSLVKTGSGTLTLSGTSTFTGTMKSSAGSIRVDGTLAATSTINLDAGRVSGTGTTGIVGGTANGGDLSPGSPSTSTGILNTKNLGFASQSSFSVQLNGTTAGTGYDQANVTGTVNLAGATLSVSLGYSPTVGDTFTIIANDSSDAVTGTFNGQAEGSTINVNGVAFTVSYVGGTGNDVTLTIGSRTETWTGAVSSSWNNAGNWSEGRIPVAGDSLVFPSGATLFTPNNDLTAATTFASVTVSGSGYTISGNSITLGASGLTASNASGSNTISLNIVLPADRTVAVSNASATLVLSGVVSGSFNLTKSGSGTLVLSGANTYNATTISAGTLQIGNGGTTGSAGSTGVTNNSALTFNRTDTWTFSNTISGSGTVAKSGSGTLTLSGSNSYSGSTTIGAGTLKISADNNLGTAPGSATPGQLTFSGGTLATTANFTLSANRGISFSSTGTIDVASSTTLTYNGIAAGSGTGLTKTGSGSLILGGSNSYSGTTTISAGTLQMGAANALSSSTAVTVTGTFDLNGNSQTIGSLAGGGTVILGAGNLTAGGDNSSTAFSGTISGTGGLTKAGSGTLNMGSATSVSVGALTISAGALTAPGSGNTFNVSGAWNNNSGTSAFTGNGGTVTFNGSSSQAIGGSFATTFNSVTVSNSAGLSLSKVMTVNGTLTLSSGNITTGSNNVYIASGASVSRTSGHIVGNLRKWIPVATGAVTFEVGDSGAYTPINVAFASVSVGGDLTATTTSGDHPSIAGSLINNAKSVNRYWTLTNSGITFTTATTTFTFVAGDVDAGADTNAFFVDEYSASTWVGPQVSTRTSTSTAAVYVSAFGDFIIGEAKIAPPTGVSASAISTRRIDMSWTDNASTETGYEIQKGTVATSYSAYTTTAANAVTQSVTGLTANTTYFLRIRTVTASGNSPWVYTGNTTLAAPAATADSYSTTQDVTLIITPPGLLANDPDGTNGIFTTSKASDPSHGSVTVNSDGSFTYTPTASYVGADSFTYKVNDGGLQSSATTVTITVASSAYVSAAAWPTSANSSRYIQLDFPAYLPTGATVSGATFSHTYRSYSGVGTTCYYIEVYEGASLLATHGSSGSPVSCNSTGSFTTDNVSLPEINTAARANAVRVRVIVWNTAGGQSEHRLANVSVNYHLD